MDSHIYEEQVHLHWSEKIVFVVQLLIMMGALVGIGLGVKDVIGKMIGLMLCIPIFISVAWRARPKKANLFMTAQEIVYREEKNETRIGIAHIKSAIACDTYVKKRGAYVSLMPRAGQKTEEVRPYRDKLNAPGRLPRQYEVRAGSALVVQLQNEAVMIFPSNQPENALAALQSVRATANH